MSMMVNPYVFAGGGGGGGGGIELVGYKHFSGGDVADADLPFDFTGLSGGLASSPSVGDLFLIILTQGGNTAGSRDLNPAPAGTVARIVNQTQVDSFDSTLGVHWGIYESGSSSGGTWDFSGNADYYIGSIIVFRGADALDVTTTTAGSANSRTADPPAITPVTAGAWIVSVATVAHRSSSSFTAPSDMTALQNLVVSAFRSCSTITALKDDWTSGAFDPAAYPPVGPSGDDLLSSWNACTIALRPS